MTQTSRNDTHAYIKLIPKCFAVFCWFVFICFCFCTPRYPDFTHPTIHVIQRKWMDNHITPNISLETIIIAWTSIAIPCINHTSALLETIITAWTSIAIPCINHTSVLCSFLDFNQRLRTVSSITIFGTLIGKFLWRSYILLLSWLVVILVHTTGSKDTKSYTNTLCNSSDKHCLRTIHEQKIDKHRFLPLQKQWSFDGNFTNLDQYGDQNLYYFHNSIVSSICIPRFCLVLTYQIIDLIIYIIKYLRDIVWYVLSIITK